MFSRRSSNLQKLNHKPPAHASRERWRAESERERRMEKDRRKTKEPTKMQVQPHPERKNNLEKRGAVVWMKHGLTEFQL